MLSEKERQELKKKNLGLINDWVKDFCSDGSYYQIEHAFRSNGRDFRVSVSKEGIGAASYGKYAQWCHVGQPDNNLETMIAGTELILRWQEIKARIITRREESVQTDEYMQNFRV